MTSLDRRSFIAAAGVAGAASLGGCVGAADSTDLLELQQWPPPEQGDSLEFWTWHGRWGFQARAFQHVAGLDDIDQATTAAVEQYRRLADGQTPDVVQLHSRQFERAAREGLFHELPVDQMPIWPPDEGSDRDGRTQPLELRLREHGLTFYERDGEYVGMPQWPISYSLAFSEDRSDRPDSWELLWDESLAGQISMPADPVLRGQIAALYTGQDPNDPNDPDAIRAALETQQPLVSNYWTDWLECWNRFDDTDLQASVLPYARTCICDNDEASVRFVAPEAGVLYSISTLAIPEGAANPYAALEFVDWAADLRAGGELMWSADDWTLHQAGAVGDDVRDTYESIAESIGPGPADD